MLVPDSLYFLASWIRNSFIFPLESASLSGFTFLLGTSRNCIHCIAINFLFQVFFSLFFFNQLHQKDDFSQDTTQKCANWFWAFYNYVLSVNLTISTTTIDINRISDFVQTTNHEIWFNFFVRKKSLIIHTFFSLQRWSVVWGVENENGKMCWASNELTW